VQALNQFQNAGIVPLSNSYAVDDIDVEVETTSFAQIKVSGDGFIPETMDLNQSLRFCLPEQI
jgi:hypothetical protein